MKETKHANIPIFIPHLGCPNQCVFCDQRTISGKNSFSEEDVVSLIEEATKTLGDRKAEIAFFGGSFTGIDRKLMVRLLDIAEGYVKSGVAVGIRMSTRPDYIDSEIIGILSRYTITEVELGIQSMTDDVLTRSKRGHSSDDTRKACALLKESGIKFVGQMMLGLPFSTLEDELYCAEEICKMGAVASRIYPTVVFKNTELEKMIKDVYIPLSIEEATLRGSSVLEVFVKHNVKCLRIGLCDSEMLHSDEKYAAGPLHPAIGELIKSELYRRIIERNLETVSSLSEIIIEIPLGATSMCVGQKGKNREYFERKTGALVKFRENSTIDAYTVRITELHK